MNSRFFSYIVLLFLTIDLHARDVGWSVFDSQTDDWQLTHGSGSVEVGEHSTFMHVQADKDAAFRIVMEPVWIYRFSELHIQYRAQHVQTGGDTPFITLDAGIIPAMPDISKPLADWNDTDKLFVDSSSIVADGEVHELVIPVYERLRLNQIDEIEIALCSNGIDAIFELLAFEFVNPNEQSGIEFDPYREWKSGQESELHPVFIQPKNNPSFFTTIPADIPKQIDVGRIPYALPDNRVVPQTAFYKRGSISIPVQRRCSELYLLMRCDLAGSDYSFELIEREGIREPERLIVEKVYDDGSVERSFPYSVDRQDYVVETKMNSYVVPVNHEKVLQEVRVMEWMSFGSVCVAGVTLNPNTDPITRIKNEDLPWTPTRMNWEAEDITPSLTVHENKIFVFENGHYHIEISAESGLWLTYVSHQKTQQNLLQEPSPLMVFMTKTFPVRNDDLHVVSYEAKEQQIQFVLSGGVVFPVELTLTVKMDDSDGLLMNLEGVYRGADPVSMQYRFPVVENLRLSNEFRDDFYFFPRKRTAWGNQRVRLKGDYSGEFPLQWMDVYSQDEQVGVAVHTQDRQLNLKRYLLLKDDDASRMAVEYGQFHPIELKAEDTFMSATSVIQIHDGDWHQALQRYKNWADQVPSTSQREYNQLKDVYIVRRDYPIGGSDLLFDPHNNEYVFDRLLDESTEEFGGVDLLEVAGWQYTGKRGRVGAYEEWEIGSAEKFRSNALRFRDNGVMTGMYVSGYLMDERSGMDQTLLQEWQIINWDGTPKRRGEHELYLNPFHPDWQKILRETAMRILDNSGAQALYLDQFGFADHGKVDYSQRFGFPYAHPLLGEHVMLVQMREMLDWLEYPVALYAEQVPVDLTSRLLDGSCSFGMTGERVYPSPTRMNAFRYAYPAFKIMEKIQPGLYPKTVDASLVKLSLFHGHGLWLKGKARSWYNRECRDVIRRAQRIYSSYGDVLGGEDSTPMIPTKQYGLFANQFEGKGMRLITVYNGTMHTIDGALVSCANETGHVADEWGIHDFSFQHDGEYVVIHGTLHPHELGCFLVK